MTISFRAARKWVVLAITCLGMGDLRADSSVFGVFVGTSPMGEEIGKLLRIPADAEAEIIQWSLTLSQEPKTSAPTGYQFRCDYGLTEAGKPGLGKKVKTLERQGKWKTTKGRKSNADARVIELENSVSLVEVDRNILHVLNADRSLMVGNGGWSYTLNRAGASEARVDAALAAAGPNISYTMSPLAKGPSVFGVFEGRTPCHGIAREMKREEHEGCMKAKWRMTLYQNPETQAPTTYRVEGTLYRRGVREGSWSIVQGTEADPNAKAYRLDTTETEPALFLLKGDDDVLFFLDQNRKLLVGHAEFSYTLNRRTSDLATNASR